MGKEGSVRIHRNGGVLGMEALMDIVGGVDPAEVVHQCVSVDAVRSLAPGDSIEVRRHDGGYPYEVVRLVN